MDVVNSWVNLWLQDELGDKHANHWLAVAGMGWDQRLDKTEVFFNDEGWSFRPLHRQEGIHKEFHFGDQQAYWLVDLLQDQQ